MQTPGAVLAPPTGVLVGPPREVSGLKDKMSVIDAEYKW